jgi:putative spermidine/putrescine transport system ATP-binding protein
LSKQSFKELHLEGVSRAFGKSVALSNLSLTIKNGEFVALLGPSGCGKSTALNCLAGLLPLSSGSIRLDERRVDNLLPERRDFGMVFQNYALFPHLTVRRNIGFGLKLKKTPKAEITRRVDAALDLVQLMPHAEKHPGQLSGGQQQRVAIARAIVLEPQLVLMDEPLSNLDAKLRHEMRGEIKRLHRELGLTTVYVTHDQEEALSLADRLVVMHDGHVQQIGTPEEVYMKPVNSFVADFMGYRNLVPMKLMVATKENHFNLVAPGITLTASTIADGVKPGSVLVAIRPEDLVVGEVHGNAINGVVRLVEYQGKDFAVEVEIGEGVVLHMRTPLKVEIGQNLTLGVNKDRVLVFPKMDS